MVIMVLAFYSSIVILLTCVHIMKVRKLIWKKVMLFLLIVAISQLNFSVSSALDVYATENANYTYYIRTETFKSKILPYRFSSGTIADQFFSIAVKQVPKSKGKDISGTVYWFAHMNGAWYTDTSDHWARLAGDKHTSFRFAPVENEPTDKAVLNAFIQYKLDRITLVGKQIADLATKRVGDGYFPGGGLFLRDADGKGGFNSSWDLIEYVFNNSEVKLSYLGLSVSMADAIKSFYNDGVTINSANLQLGDIVFFKLSNNSTPSDAGIYIGNGKYVYASRSQGKIIVGNLGENTSDHNNMTLVYKKYLEKYMKY